MAFSATVEKYRESMHDYQERDTADPEIYCDCFLFKVYPDLGPLPEPGLRCVMGAEAFHSLMQ